MDQDEIPSPSGDSDEEGNRPDPFPYSESEDIVLPEDYTPTKHDVINGRGRKSYNHIANRRFRQLISMSLERYMSARCKVDKTLVVVGIVDTIRNAKPTGGFLKRCAKTARWISMSDESAREKVGHCLRDMIASQRDGKEKGAKGSPKKQGKATAAAGKGSTPTSAKSPGRNAAADATASKNDNPNHNPNMMMMNNPWIAPPPDGAPHPGPPHPHHPQHPMYAGNPGMGPEQFAMWSAMHHHAAAMAHQQGRYPYGPPPPEHLYQHNNKDGPPVPPPPPPPIPAQGRQSSSHKNNNNDEKGNSKKNSKSNKKREDSPPAETSSLQKGNFQDMSEEQRSILTKLENGWTGTVEELMESVQ